MIERIFLRKKYTFGGGANHSAENCFKKIRKDKEKSRASGDLDRKRTERTPCDCFICVSVDNLIAKCPKPPKDNEKMTKYHPFQ